MLQQLDTAIAFVVVMLMLSLLVTAMVQVLSALLDLRGKNLARALSDLLKQVDVSFRDQFISTSSKQKIRDWWAHPFSRITFATKLADSITRHPTLAQTFSRAKAIRKDELLDVLKDLCSANPAGKIDGAVRKKLQDLLAKQVPGATESIGTAQVIANQLANKFPALKEDVERVVGAAMGSVNQLEAEIGKWFDTVMDRASDIFTRWTRTITVAVSIVLVVALQIDAGLILHQISSNPQIKAGLTKMSEAALSEADDTLKNGDRGSAALKALAGNHKGDAVEADLGNATHLVSCVDGKNWLNKYSVRAGSKVTADQLSTEFQDLCEKQTLAALDGSRDEIARLRHDLATTELQLIPNDPDDAGVQVFNKGDATFKKRVCRWYGAYRNHPSHMLGTLAMVVFLSLGAPFWFNALRQLSNLKPTISKKIETEQASA